MKEKIKIEMYKMYIYGKVFNFLVWYAVILGIILFIGSLTNIISKENSHETLFLSGLFMLLITTATFALSDVITTSARTQLPKKLEIEEQNLAKFELYLENLYKEIPKKEEEKLKKLKAKIILTEEKLKLISPTSK